MAAPSTVYSSNVLKVQQGSGTPAVLALLPLSLTEYGSDVNMKALFYLDEVKHCLDVSDKDVIQALVKDSGANYLMHAPARLGMGRYYKDGQNYILLNDGGLNTYGRITNNTTDNYVHAQNRVEVSFTLYSAYYCKTTGYGYRYRLNSGAWVDKFDSVEQYDERSVVTIDRHFVPDLINGAYPAIGTQIEIEAYIENGEGRKYYHVYTFNLTEEVMVLDALYYATTSTTTPTPITLYIRVSDWDALDAVTEGGNGGASVVFYTDAIMLTTAAAGWYDVNKSTTDGKRKLFCMLHGSIDSYYPLENSTPSTKYTLWVNPSLDGEGFSDAASLDYSGHIIFTTSPALARDVTINYTCRAVDSTTSHRKALKTGSVVMSSNQTYLSIPVSKIIFPGYDTVEVIVDHAGLPYDYIYENSETYVLPEL